MLLLCYRCKDAAYVIKLLRKSNLLPHKVDVFNRFVREEFPNLIDLKQVVMTHPIFQCEDTRRDKSNKKQLVSRMGLVNLMKTFGLKHQGAHNSAHDAQMTLEMYFFMLYYHKHLACCANKLWSLASCSG